MKGGTSSLDDVFYSPFLHLAAGSLDQDASKHAASSSSSCKNTSTVISLKTKKDWPRTTLTEIQSIWYLMFHKEEAVFSHVSCHWASFLSSIFSHTHSLVSSFLSCQNSSHSQIQQPADICLLNKISVILSFMSFTTKLCPKPQHYLQTVNCWFNVHHPPVSFSTWLDLTSHWNTSYYLQPSQLQSKQRD